MMDIRNQGPFAILHLVASIGRQSGGLGSAAINLAREQCTLGYQAQIWCLDSYAHASEVARENDLIEGAFVTYPVTGPARIGFSLAMQHAAVSPQGGNYSVLHQHGIWLATSRVTEHWRAGFGRPTVVAPQGTLEDYALHRSAWKKRLAIAAYEGDNLRAASCLQATSNSEAASFRKYGLTNPIAVIPNGVPDLWIHSNGNPGRFFSRFSIPTRHRLLLFLSRIHPKKGLPILLEALAQLKPHLDGWLLVIAGPDERGHLNEVRLLVQKFHLEQLVRFIGPLFGSDKRDAFAAADLFVLPTHSENFGIVVAEALGAGVPVLTTRGAPWETLATRECGWWVDVRVDAIRDALQDATQRTKSELSLMGQRGRAVVSEKFTWSSIGRQSIALYDWLLGHGTQPGFVLAD